jgi:type II secretory pathway pseudopilin PulG
MLELLVSITIMVTLASFVLAVVSKSRLAANSAQCVANVHSIALALGQDARDHGDYYPDPVAMNRSWEQCLTPYISSPQVFQCPGDDEIYPSVGSSYGWRDTGVANTTLAGKTIHDVNRLTTILIFESLPGWHGRQTINAATVDGSAHVMQQAACLSDLQTPIR